MEIDNESLSYKISQSDIWIFLLLNQVLQVVKILMSIESLDILITAANLTKIIVFELVDVVDND